MNTSEPEGWSFSNTKFKIYESGLSSSDDSSDDEDLFSKTKSIKKKNLKKWSRRRNSYPNNFPRVLYIMSSVTSALRTVDIVTQELQTQTLNSIVGGFSFAAAMSWMDFIRWSITQIVKVPKNGGTQYALTAVLTSLLSVIVFMVISRINKNVKKPAQPVYAITR